VGNKRREEKRNRIFEVISSNESTIEFKQLPLSSHDHEDVEVYKVSLNHSKPILRTRNLRVLLIQFDLFDLEVLPLPKKMTILILMIPPLPN